MSDTAEPTAGEAPAAPNSSEPFIDRAWDAFEKDAVAKDAPAAPAAPVTVDVSKPVATQAVAVQTPAQQAMAALAYKFNHADESIDETWLTDAEKSKQLREWIETGRGHKQVVERVTRDSNHEGQKSLAAHLAKLGVQFKPKTQSPRTFDDYEIAFPTAAMPAGTPSDDPLAKEIAALTKKVEEETATAADIVKLPNLQRQLEQRQAKAEADRSAQDARTAEEKRQTEAQIDDALVQTIDGRAKAFEGVAKELADPMRSVVWNLARRLAIESGGGPAAAQANATDFLNHMEACVNARIKHLTATATPPASPVIGGTPAGAAGSNGASKGRPSMHNESWLDGALEESAARR